MYSMLYRSKNLPFVINFVLLVSTISVISAQENAVIPTAERVRTLNNEVLSFHGLTRDTGRKQIQARSAEVRSHASGLMKERAAVLGKLMEENPEQALSLAFSPEAAADLAAAFPESTDSIERYGTWHGPIER